MIIFDNVHKFLAGTYILKGVNFEIKQGETFVIVGPSGTGKSVTIRHMIGLHKPDQGRIIVGGQDVGLLEGRALERFRCRFGVLFQSGALLNWMNIRDNVGLPLKETTRIKKRELDRKVNEVLALVGLEDAGEKMPSDISGGMMKRAGLARAIITEPEIILYDEPTSGLDPIMSRKIDALIASLKKKLKITSVVVTHDLHSAFGIGDRIAMLNGGKVIECGTVQEFKKSKNDFVQEFIAAQ
jgi:phospholipid/cholesterol/gamma-HCH transport system ATP-binding protein